MPPNSLRRILHCEHFLLEVSFVLPINISEALVFIANLIILRSGSPFIEIYTKTKKKGWLFTLYLRLAFANTFTRWPTALTLPLRSSVFAPGAVPALSLFFFFLSHDNLEVRGPANYYYILRCSSLVIADRVITFVRKCWCYRVSKPTARCQDTPTPTLHARDCVSTDAGRPCKPTVWTRFWREAWVKTYFTCTARTGEGESSMFVCVSVCTRVSSNSRKNTN